MVIIYKIECLKHPKLKNGFPVTFRDQLTEFHYFPLRFLTEQFFSYELAYIQIKMLFSIYQFSFVCHLASWIVPKLHCTLLVYGFQYIEKIGWLWKNWKRLGGGFPWIFMESKNCSWLSQMVSHNLRARDQKIVFHDIWNLRAC